MRDFTLAVQQFLPSKVYIYLLVIIKLILFVPKVYALEHIEVSGTENGLRLGENFELWHDPSGKSTLDDARSALSDGLFSPLNSKGSTGLQPGAFWSRFHLKNTSPKPLVLHLEYVDHQLIQLEAYEQASLINSEWIKTADLALYNDFSDREIAHQRFVFKTEIPALSSTHFLIKYSSDKAGYVFPDLRLWSAENLRNTQSIETTITAFLLGGLFLMSLFALVAGITTKSWLFYSYAIYAFAKLVAWCTILGYTHQFLMRSNFHWSYMSLSGAFVIFASLLFARVFLQTRKYTKKFDYVLKFMMLNAALLFASALLKITALSILSITLALLLYPVLPIIGLVRWRQGSKEALVYSFAWMFLASGLVLQAMRDLGHIEHNFFNYYWPPVFSFMEILVVMVAMGVRINSFRNEKEKAEKEAQTDVLTGTNNRRYFLYRSQALFEQSKNRSRYLSLLMFDIDHFKSINDRFGHAAGDKVLKEFSDFICSQIREEDVFGRLGGEEFALIVSQTDPDLVKQLGNRLRSEVSKLSVEFEGHTIRFSVSVGVAHIQQEQHLDELINKADKALYHAKENGRNRLEMAV